MTRSRTLRSIGTVTTAAAAITFLAGCSGSGASRTDTEAAVKARYLAVLYQRKAFPNKAAYQRALASTAKVSVTCPRSVTYKSGTAFACTVTDRRFGDARVSARMLKHGEVAVMTIKTGTSSAGASTSVTIQATKSTGL